MTATAINPAMQELLGFAKDGNFKLKLTPRHAIVAPPGYVLASVDFSNQEMYIGAVLSQDQVMLNAFSAPLTISIESKEYPNPDTDLHTLTTVNCCFPSLFEGVPKHLWVATAKDESLITMKGSPRDFAKRTNFGILYLATAKTLAETNHVKESAAQTWIDLHTKTYHGFHNWAEEIAAIVTARGWIQNSVGRWRWCAEDNAKAAGASPARSGVNFMIQGLAADMSKLACIKVSRALSGSKAKILALIHDEIIALVPGRCSLNVEKTLAKIKKVNGEFLIPVFDADEEATYWGNVVKQCMEEAESELFDWRYPGKAECSISPYWNH